MNGTRQNGRPGPARRPWSRLRPRLRRAPGAAGRRWAAPSGARTRRRRRSNPGSASTCPRGRCVSTPIRWRIASGSTCSAPAKAPTAGTVIPAADAAAIETRPTSGARAALVAAILRRHAAAVAPVRADDHITVRGAYFREASTRVIQPVVEISKDLPSGFDVTAHYLLDAITSASVAAGTVGRHDLHRDAQRGRAGAWARPGIAGAPSLGYQYSAESDYWSHGVSRLGRATASGATARRSRASGGLSFDGAWPRTRTPDCPTRRRS